MKAIESVQITLQLLKCVMYAGVTYLFLTNSIVFPCFENIYLELNILHLW